MLLVLVGGIAWVMSDRQARLERMAIDVKSFLQLADLLYADNKLPEALSEVRKAQVILGTTGLSDEELNRRVTQKIKELETASQLEEIILDQSSSSTLDRGYADYARVFREFGVDVEALQVEEAAARISSSKIKLDLVLALNRWATNLKADSRRLVPGRWQHLQAISQATDSDPWRDRFNKAFEDKNLNELRKLEGFFGFQGNYTI